jgi:hypothetical protein
LVEASKLGEPRESYAGEVIIQTGDVWNFLEFLVGDFKDLDCVPLKIWDIMG